MTDIMKFNNFVIITILSIGYINGAKRAKCSSAAHVS